VSFRYPESFFLDGVRHDRPVFLDFLACIGLDDFSDIRSQRFLQKPFIPFFAAVFFNNIFHRVFLDADHGMETETDVQIVLCHDLEGLFVGVGAGVDIDHLVSQYG
jgi:hypothetical protein